MGFPTTSGLLGYPPNQSWTFGRVNRPLLDIREGLSSTPAQPGWPPGNCRTSTRPSHHSGTFGRASRPLPVTGRVSRPLSNICESFPITSGNLGGHPDHSWTLGRAYRPLLDSREGFPTTSGLLGYPPNQSWTFGRVNRPLLDIREGLPSTPAQPGWLPGNCRTSRRTSHHSGTSGRASPPLLVSGSVFRPLSDIREGISATLGH